MAEKPARAKGEKGGKGGANKFPKGLVLVVARTVSGIRGEDWKKLDQDKKKPHMQLAKKVLSAQERFNAKPAGEKRGKGKQAVADDGDDI